MQYNLINILILSLIYFHLNTKKILSIESLINICVFSWLYFHFKTKKILGLESSCGLHSKKILGIESSCDDTCLSIINVINDEINVLANVKIHHKSMCDDYKGVVPDLAARNHFYNLNIGLEKALTEANMTIDQIDIIGCTIGPGLLSSLILGSSFAKYLSSLTKKIFIPVHHLEAHLDILQENPPYLAVIISGGHTQIIHVKSHYECEEICTTRDDAVGELFDKIGRKLNLDVPSGMHIEKLALKNTMPIYKKDIVKVLPKSLSFSFSGLKTHFLLLINKNEYNKEYICDLLQQTVAYNLHTKIQMAIKKTNCTKVIVGGGVSANQYIRKILHYCQFAPIELCMDNGLMVCISAYKHYKNNHINYYNIEPFATKKLQDWFTLLNKL